ncbi:hypothetical protein AGABI2DRAFT_179079 [Agaricus bisporus var. bisporus H97]|uniref:hypothetical protein n=1 Tax=Agaricus bisporus var. bisporus (strain H97 / ATCC MYA-4626 / FGSC 10389) TaxID=936046 RepID=UPI00029F75E1|nr:hypothetical protein AGABI2DRAFT_179079 [Agaricus bisporus var. bisporus H97]EKV46920.1 hypothetical protein AGABI2DRAFT_179079 [Agaricus bisporus var. bisporus H97]
MKGCLKLPSRAPSPTSCSVQKHVVFDDEGSEQVFFADEWDRTPAEPARNLSYQDILELKQIQRSLPRAIQPANGSGTSHFLSNVPIGLLPLLPESDTASPPASNVASTMSFSPNSWRTVRTPAPSIPHTTPTSIHPSHLSHLPPARPPVTRERSRFAFLPLLGTDNNGPPPRSPSPPCSPPPSERSSSPDHLMSDAGSDVSHDPPTPALTSASLDSSPLSRASSCSPEPPFFQLPLARHRGRWRDTVSSDDLIASSSHLPSSTLSSAHSSSESLIHDPYDYRRPGYGASTKSVAAQPIPIPDTRSTRKKPKEEKKKNVIVINGMEIELDDDNQQEEEDDESASELEIDEGGNTPPAKPTLSILPPPPRDQIVSPTPTTARPPLSPTISLHTPICFKRTSTPSSASSPSRSPPVTKQTCSPSRHGSNGAAARSNPLLVPSA